MSLADVLEKLSELRGEREIETLAGGLTNTNYKITTLAGRYVVRISGKDSGLLRNRQENEVHNTIAAAGGGLSVPPWSRCCRSTTPLSSSSSTAR